MDILTSYLVLLERFKGGNMSINHVAFDTLPWDSLQILAVDKLGQIEMFFLNISLFLLLFISLCYSFFVSLYHSPSLCSIPPSCLLYVSIPVPLCLIVFVVLLVMHDFRFMTALFLSFFIYLLWCKLTPCLAVLSWKWHCSNLPYMSCLLSPKLTIWIR